MCIINGQAFSKGIVLVRLTISNKNPIVKHIKQKHNMLAKHDLLLCLPPGLQQILILSVPRQLCFPETEVKASSTAQLSILSRVPNLPLHSMPVVKWKQISDYIRAKWRQINQDERNRRTRTQARPKLAIFIYFIGYKKDLHMWNKCNNPLTKVPRSTMCRKKNIL